MKTYFIGKNGSYKSRYSNSDGFWDTNGSQIINTGLNTIGSVLSNIFGTSDKYKAMALESINEQQRKTNTILWVVIGLMAALGVVLLIRKSK